MGSEMGFALIVMSILRLIRWKLIILLLGRNEERLQ